MTPGEKHAIYRLQAENHVKYEAGGLVYKPSPPQCLTSERQGLVDDDMDDNATVDSFIDDGFEETQDCGFSQDYYFD